MTSFGWAMVGLGAGAAVLVWRGSVRPIVSRAFHALFAFIAIPIIALVAGGMLIGRDMTFSSSPYWPFGLGLVILAALVAGHWRTR